MDPWGFRHAVADPESFVDDQVELPQCRRSTIRARAEHADGSAITGAVLTVTDLNGQQVSRTITDASGYATTRPIPVGSYTAILTAPNYAPVARTAVLDGERPTTLDAVLLNRVVGIALPAAGSWVIDPAHSAVLVSARHLGLSSIRGRFNEFGGVIQIANPAEKSSVKAEIQAHSIDTGNTTRDEHLRSADFLDAATHPTIQFDSTNLVPRGPDNWLVEGELQLHAVTRDVTLELHYLGVEADPWGNTRAAFHAATDLHRKDFAIDYHQLVRAGISAVGMTLRVELDIQAVLSD